MKKYLLLVMFIISLVSLSACQKNSSISDSSTGVSAEGLPEPTLPLDKDTIMKTAGELGLPCVISEEESQESLTRENAVYSNYVLRDPDKTYESGQNTVLYGGIISGIVDGNRYLSAVFDARSHLLDGKALAWEDWKQEIVFITKLYGGFEDEEEVYRALSNLDVPDDDHVLKWGVQLSNGYCGVQRGAITQPTKGYGYALWINFYESEELYLKSEQDKKEAWEKAQEDTKKRKEEFLKKQQEELGEMSQ